MDILQLGEGAGGDETIGKPILQILDLKEKAFKNERKDKHTIVDQYIHSQKEKENLLYIFFFLYFHENKGVVL